MEKATEKATHAEERGGATERVTAGSDVKHREGTCTQAEHRGRHSKVHKGSGGHKQSKKRSNSSGHKAHSRSSSRRDSHSHARHTEVHQAEVEKAAERHEAGDQQHSSSAKESSGNGASKDLRVKTKSKKATKSSNSSSCAHGSARERRKREGCISSKKGSRKEAGAEDGRCSSTPLSSRKKRGVDRAECRGRATEGRDFSEIKRSSKRSTSSSRTERSSRSSSDESRGCNSGDSNSGRSSAERSRTVPAPPGCSSTSDTIDRIPLETSLLPSTGGGNTSPLGPKKKELLPLPPLPKAAAVAAAALQEQCLKKKGQQAKASKRAAAIPAVESPFLTANKASSGTTADIVPTATAEAQTTRRTLISGQNTVLIQPSSTLPQRSSGGLTAVAAEEKLSKRAQDIATPVVSGDAEASAVPASIAAGGKQKHPVHTFSKKSFSGVSPLPGARATLPRAHGTTGGERGKTAEQTAETEEVRFPAKHQDDTQKLGRRAEGASVKKTVTQGVETEVTSSSEEAIMKNGAMDSGGAFEAPRKVPARRRARTAVTAGDVVRAGAAVPLLQKGGAQGQGGAKKSGAQLLTTTARCPEEEEARAVVETAAKSAEMPTSARGGGCVGNSPEALSKAGFHAAVDTGGALQEAPRSAGKTQGKGVTTPTPTVAAVTSIEESVKTTPATVQTIGDVTATGMHVKEPTSAAASTGGTAATAAMKRADKGADARKKSKKEEIVDDADSRGGFGTRGAAAGERQAGEEAELEFSLTAAQGKTAVGVAEGVKEVPVGGDLIRNETAAAELEKEDPAECTEKKKRTVGDTNRKENAERLTVASVAAEAGNSGKWVAAASEPGRSRTGEGERCVVGREGADPAEILLPAGYPSFAAAYGDGEDSGSEPLEATASENADSPGSEPYSSASSQHSSDTDESEGRDNAETDVSCEAGTAVAAEEPQDTAAVVGAVEDVESAEENASEKGASGEETEDEIEEGSDEEQGASEEATEGSLERDKVGDSCVSGATDERVEEYAGRLEACRSQAVGLSSARSQQPDRTETAAVSKIEEPVVGTSEADAGKANQPAPPSSTEQLKETEGQGRANEDSEEEETPADARADVEGEDAAACMSSPAASPSHYYSPSAAEGSNSSSPDSPTEATGIDSGCGAEGGEEEEETSAVYQREEQAPERAEGTTELEATAEREKRGNGARLLVNGNVDEAPQVSPSGYGTAAEAVTSDGVTVTKTLCATESAAAGESESGAEGRSGGGSVRVPASEAPATAMSVSVARVDAATEEVEQAVKEAGTEKETASLPGKTLQEKTRFAHDGGNDVAEKLQPAVDPVNNKSDAPDGDGTKTEDIRQPQRPAALAESMRSRVWEEGLKLWKLLLRCEQEAYDFAHLRVLGNFACSRAEFVSVSSGCLGQPERGGDATEMPQQHEQLTLEFHAVRNRLQEGMARAGLGPGSARRKPSRLQQALISAERRMEEELLQVNQLLQLQSLQHMLQQQRQQGRLKGSDSGGARRPSSSERTAGGSGLERRGRSGVYRRGGIPLAEEDGAHETCGKGLLQLMSSTPLCWYVHDVVGMVCRRRSGGPFPERWEEYKEWCGDLDLEDVYKSWKDIVLQRKIVDRKVQNSASTKMLAPSESKESSTKADVGGEGVETVKDEAGIAQTPTAAEKDKNEQCHERVQTTQSSLCEDDQKNTGCIAAAGAQAKVGVASGMEQTPTEEVQVRQKSDEQRGICEEETVESQPHQLKKQPALLGHDQSMLADAKEATEKHQNIEDTDAVDQGGMDPEPGGSISVHPSSDVAGGAHQRDEGQEEEQGAPSSSKKRKRTEPTASPIARFPPVKGSYFCGNEEMMQHLVLLPCKAFLADRFFLTCPEKKTLSFGTSCLKQRVAAMRMHKSWRVAPSRAKQQLLHKEQLQMDQQRQEEERQQQHPETGEPEDKAEAKVGGGATPAAAVEETSRGKTEVAAEGSTNSEASRRDRGGTAGDPQQQIVASTKEDQQSTTLDRKKTCDEELETAAKRRKNAGEGANVKVLAGTEPALVKEKLEEQSAVSLPVSDAKLGEPAAYVKGATGFEGGGTLMKSNVLKDLHGGGRRAARLANTTSAPDLGPEVVAVINLCMTERYYPLTELRAQGIESYWLKVDGSGELPTEKVVCTFFRLLAFITHKYAKLKRQQQSASGVVDVAKGRGTMDGAGFRVAGTAAGEEANAEREVPAESARGGTKNQRDVAGTVGVGGKGTMEDEERCTQKHTAEEETGSNDDAAAHVGGEARADAVWMAAEDINDSSSEAAEKFTVLVHCTNGVNRTGLFIALLLMNLMGCNYNFALKTFADARGSPVTKDMFKRWLCTEEAKGLPKVYRQALQPPVLEGRVLAYKQREQRSLGAVQQEQGEHRKEKEGRDGPQEGWGTEGGQQQQEKPRKQSIREERESQYQQQHNVIGGEQQLIKKLQDKESPAENKKSNTAAGTPKGTGNEQKKQQRQKHPTGETPGVEQQVEDDGEQKEGLQEQTKQKQANLERKHPKAKQGKQQQKSSQQSSEVQDQTQQEQAMEEQEQQKVAAAPKEADEGLSNDEEDLTVPTPFALIRAFESERNVERNLEARLSVCLERTIATREKERQRLLAASWNSQGTGLTGREKQEARSSSSSSARSGALTGDTKAAEADHIRGASASSTSEAAKREPPEEKRVPEQQTALDTDMSGIDGTGAPADQAGCGKGTKFRQSSGQGTENEKRSKESDQHRMTGSATLQVTENATGAAGDKPAATAAGDVLTSEDNAKIKGKAGRSNESRTLAEAKAPETPTDADRTTATQLNAGRVTAVTTEVVGCKIEALQAMERSFQAEIDILEDLRNQARTAMEDIPPLPARLPLDGIVLVGPIQNSLLAPEELLLQLLVGCPTLKIESLDILVGSPSGLPHSDAARAAAETDAAAAALGLGKKTSTLAEMCGTTASPKETEAACTARERAPAVEEEGLEPAGGHLSRKSTREQQLLYKPLWPESALIYPAPLVPIQTRKRSKVTTAESASERVRRQEGGVRGSTERSAGVQTLLSSRKREREGSQEPCAISKGERHSQQQVDKYPQEDRDSGDDSTGRLRSSRGQVTKGSAPAVKKEEAASGDGGANANAEGGPLQQSLGSSGTQTRQTTPTALNPNETGSSRGAATTDVETSQQQQRLQSGSGTQLSQVRHTLERLTKVATLEVIEEEAEERLEEQDAASLAASPADVPFPPQSDEREDETSAADEHSNQSAPLPSDRGSAVTPALGSPYKKQCVEVAGDKQRQDAMEDGASPASIKNVAEKGNASAALHRTSASGCSPRAVEVSSPVGPTVLATGASELPQDSANAALPGGETTAHAGERDKLFVGKGDTAGEGIHSRANAEKEETAAERTKTTGACKGVTERVKASDFSLTELRRTGNGLFSQRELALRLLEYREEDDLRLCYIARIQCADESSFLYLLSHQLQRMRQQSIQVYPSFCYPLLFKRGKRLDREIFTHAKAMVLAANASPAVTAAVHAAAAVRKGVHHDFLWLLGSAAGGVKRGKNTGGRISAGDAGDRSSLLSGRGLPFRRVGGATPIPPVNMFLSPPFMHLHMSGTPGAHCGRSPFGGSRGAAAAAGTDFYDPATFGRGAALGRLAPWPPPSIHDPVARCFVKPFLSSKLAFFGAAAPAGAGRNNGTSSLSPPRSRGSLVGSHTVGDLGCCWPPFAPFDLRADAHERALLCQSTGGFYEGRRLFPEGGIPPPPPGFVCFADTPVAAAQSRRLRTLGAVSGSRAPVVARTAQGMMTTALAGSAGTAAALKLRRGVVNRSNLAAHRREVVLLGSGSRALSGGTVAAAALPPYMRRSGSAAAFYSAAAAETPRSTGTGAQTALGNNTVSGSKRTYTNKRSLSRGGKRNEGQATAGAPSIRGTGNGLDQQRVFPIGGGPPFPLPPAPPLDQFFLETPVSPHGGLAAGGTGPGGPSNLHVSYMDVDCLGSTSRAIDYRPFGVATGMQQQAGCTMWMANTFGNRSISESGQQQIGAGKSCPYMPLEGGDESTEGMARSAPTPVTRTGMWGMASLQSDSVAAQASYATESRTGAGGRNQDLTSGIRAGQGGSIRGELQRGEKRDRSQQRAAAQPRNTTAMKRAPPPPPPLPKDPDACGRDSGTRSAKGAQGAWGESAQLVSPTAAAGGWRSINWGGLLSADQQKYQQPPYQQQQRATGGAAGGKKVRVSGWREESNSASACGREKQASNLWDAGQRNVETAQNPATVGGGADGNTAGAFPCVALQQQRKIQPSLAMRTQQEATWGRGAGEKEREAAGVMWAQQEREKAGISGDSAGAQPGRVVLYSQTAVAGAPTQHQQQVQKAQNVRGSQTASGRGISGEGTAECGTVADSVVSDAAARAAAAMVACQQQQMNKGNSGGTVDVWKSQVNTWDGEIFGSARTFRSWGNPPTHGAGEHSYGRGEGSNQRLFTGGETGGTRTGGGEGNTGGRQMLQEVKVTGGGTATGTTWKGMPVAIRGQQKQQQGYFRQNPEQRVHGSSPEGSSTEAAVGAELGATFAPGDPVGGDRGMSLRAEGGDNNRGNARSTALVSGGPRIYGSAAATAVPRSVGSSGHGEPAAVAGAHSFGFPGGRQAAEGDTACAGSSVYPHEGYASFPTRPTAVVGGNDSTVYGVDGKRQQGVGTEISNRGGVVKDNGSYRTGGKVGAETDRMQQQTFNGSNAEYSTLKRGGPGTDAWGQGSGGTNFSRMGSAPPTGRVGYGRGRTTETEMGLSAAGAATVGSGSGTSMPPYSGYPAARLGGLPAAAAVHHGMTTGDKGGINSGPRREGVTGEGYGFGSSSAVVATPHGAAASGEAFGESGVVEGREKGAAFGPSIPGVAELGSVTAMSAGAEGTQQQFAPRGSGNQGRRFTEQHMQCRGDGAAGGGNAVGAPTVGTGPGGPDGRRINQGNGTRFTPVQRKTVAGGGPPVQRAGGGPPEPPHWTIRRLFQGAGAPRSPASDTGVEQRQPGNSIRWEDTSRATRGGGTVGRVMTNSLAAGPTEGALLGSSVLMKQHQQHNILAKHKQADWGAFGHTSDGSGLLWPSKISPEGVMPTAAGGGQQPSTQQQQQQTAMMIQFAQQLALMQQQQQQQPGLAGSAARGTSVDSFSVATNPLASLISNFQQGGPGLVTSSMSQQQLQQQLLMMCMLQQQQQQQTGNIAPIPGMSAVDLQQLMLYTQYYSMLLGGMSEQQATATVQAQQLLQRQQEEIMKQQLLHQSIQQQQQLQLSLAGFGPSPTTSLSALGDPCKGPSPT